MMIDGVEFKMLPYPEPRIFPAIRWTVDSAGYYHGSDRGAAQDIYESVVRYVRPKADIEGLEYSLNLNRETSVLSSFTSSGQELFGPEVSYAGSINATVTNYGNISNTHFNKIEAMELTFRALSPTLLATTPAFTSLRLEEGWEGGQDWRIGKSHSMTQVASYADHHGSLGHLVGSFTVKPTEARAIIAYLMVTARANTIILPTFSGVTYPFGYSRGAGPFNVKIPKWEIRRKDLNRWVIKIEFREAP